VLERLIVRNVGWSRWSWRLRLEGRRSRPTTGIAESSHKMGTAWVQLRGKNWLPVFRKRHQGKPLGSSVPYFGTRRSKVQILSPRPLFPLSNLYFTQHFPERQKTQNWVHWVQQRVFAPKSQNLSPVPRQNSMRTEDSAIPSRDGCPIQVIPSPSSAKNSVPGNPSGIPVYIRMEEP